jgi:hypothetical protein
LGDALKVAGPGVGVAFGCAAVAAGVAPGARGWSVAALPVGTSAGVRNAAAVRAALAGVCSGVQAVSSSTVPASNA